MAFSYGQHPPRLSLANKYHGDYNKNFQERQNSRPRMPYAAVNQFRGNPYVAFEEHWCETCDRGFRTADILEKHKQQHEKCNIDGCQFIAHPKVITKHIQMQHSSGLYKKIANLNNPEDIKKWIEERKKKYPTINNIEKKIAATKEKIERGEKMGLYNNERNKKIKPGSKRKFENNYDNNIRTKRTFRGNVSKDSTHPKPSLKHNKNISKKPHNIISVVETERKLKPFAGIQDLEMLTEINEEINNEDSDSNFLIDDDAVCFNDAQDTPTNEPVVCNALSFLMCNYEFSDEEDESDKEKEISNLEGNTKTQETKKCLNSIQAELQIQNSITTEPNVNKINEENNSDCDSGPEEVKIEKHIEIESNSTETQIEINKKPLTKKKVDGPEMKHKTYTNIKSKIPSTLLQKLLHKEVQHERNIILQCIRYIIKNNYFDK